jgi:hypothetical protein
VRSEDYERGYYVGEQRAINRMALGLPLHRPSTDIEIIDMAIIGLQEARKQAALADFPPITPILV